MRYYIAIDFDGTLVKNEFPYIGKTNKKVISKLKRKTRELIRLGYDPVFILWTCRADHGDGQNYLSDAVNWCKEEFPYEITYVNENPDMNFGRPDLEKKIFADEYWDDRAYNPTK